MSVSTSLRAALQQTLPSDLMYRVTCEYCLADKARQHGQPSFAEWATGDAAVGLAHMDGHRPAGNQRAGLLTRVKGGAFLYAALAVNQVRSVPPVFAAMSLAMPITVGGLVVPLVGLHAALREASAASLPPWLLLALSFGGLETAFRLDIPRPEAGSPSLGGAGFVQDAFIRAADRFREADRPGEAILLACACGVRFGSELPRLGLASASLAAAGVGAIAGVIVAGASLLMDAAFSLALDPLADWLDAFATRIRPNFFPRAPANAEWREVPRGPDGGVPGFRFRHEVMLDREIPQGNLVPEIPAVHRGAAAGENVGPVAGEGTPVAAPVAGGREDFQAGINVHDRGRTPATRASVERLLARFAPENLDVRMQLRALQAYISGLRNAGAPIATQLHASSRNSPGRAPLTQAAAAQRVVRTVLQTAETPADFMFFEFPAGRIVATVWAAIQCLPAERGGTPTAEQVRTERNEALFLALADCVEWSGTVVCGPGQVQRIMIKLQGYYKEVQIEAYDEPPTAADIINVISLRLKAELGEAPEPAAATIALQREYRANLGQLMPPQRAAFAEAMASIAWMDYDVRATFREDQVRFA